MIVRTDLVSDGVSASIPDRRRHARYRFSAPITVHSSNGSAIPGMSLEISQSGMSALLGDVLTVGDRVEVEPVAGGRVSALIVRNSGKIYAFEFLHLSPAQVRRIGENCKMLPRYNCKTLDV